MQKVIKAKGLVEGGMKPIQAIISATKTAAEAMDLYSTIGSVEAEKQTDLIVTDGNPIDNISALSKVLFVLKAGKISLHQGFSLRSC